VLHVLACIRLHQAYQYRNLIKEDIIKSRGGIKVFLIHSYEVCVNKNTVLYKTFEGTLPVH
jgi:hypothetical protein